MRVFFVFLVSLVAAGAQAATFTQKTVDGTLVVSLTGTIVAGDDVKFLQAVGNSTKARVTLQSDGGSVLTALTIGTYIRNHHFGTLVAHNDSCASACAIIWVAGTPRSVGAHAQVGFHAAYDPTNGNQVTSVGNALIGAYFARIGLSDRAIAYLTAAAPNDMRWLSLADAESIGVDVRMLRGTGVPALIVTGTGGPLVIPLTGAAPAPKRVEPAQTSAGTGVTSPDVRPQADPPSSAVPPQMQRSDVRGVEAAGSVETR